MFNRKKKLKLSAGQLEFLIPVDGEEVAWSADIIVLKLAIEEAESLHIVPGEDGSMVANEAFLNSLSGAAVNAGCPRCTPTMARQLWVAVTNEYNRQEAIFRDRLSKTLG